MEEDQGEYPDSLLYHFPSQVRLDALPELVDISVSRTLLTALLTALKANGKDEASSSFYLLQPYKRKSQKQSLPEDNVHSEKWCKIFTQYSRRPLTNINNTASPISCVQVLRACSARCSQQTVSGWSSWRSWASWRSSEEKRGAERAWCWEGCSNTNTHNVTHTHPNRNTWRHLHSVDIQSNLNRHKDAGNSAHTVQHGHM